MADKIFTTYLPTFLLIVIPMIGSWVMGFIAGKSYENHRVHKILDKKIHEQIQRKDKSRD